MCCVWVGDVCEVCVRMCVGVGVCVCGGVSGCVGVLCECVVLESLQHLTTLCECVVLECGCVCVGVFVCGCVCLWVCVAVCPCVWGRVW
jgi:hypothetical protein